MPDYPEPLDISGVETYALRSRKSKVGRDKLARPVGSDDSFAAFWKSLPSILAAEDLKELVARLHRAREANKAILWGLGAHVIKVGLSNILIDLMDQGFVQGIALNGAGIIHDYEMAMVGQTSEEVAEGLRSGAFGMAEETGRDLNLAIQTGVAAGKGIGESVGAHLANSDAEHRDVSLLFQAYQRSIPVTVHVAIGTDIIHMHPQASGEAIGEASLLDFRLMASMVRRLDGGGVYLNVGSAVLLPEVFLKAVSVVRNLGFSLGDFSTANFDFIRQYRPRVNVVQRPVTGEGRGFDFVGHHELMLPLLAAAMKSRD